MTKLTELHDNVIQAALNPSATDEQIITAKAAFVAEVEATETKLSELSATDATAIEAENATLKADLAAANTQLESAKADLADVQIKAENLQTQLTEATANVVELNATITSANAEISNLTAAKETAETKVADLETVNKQLAEQTGTEPAESTQKQILTMSAMSPLQMAMDAINTVNNGK